MDTEKQAEFVRLYVRADEAAGTLHAQALEVWVCPVCTDCLPLSHGTSSQSNLFVI